MQIVEHAVISAAGVGSRLQLNMPKCLVDIGGRKLIDYQLDLLVNVPDVRIVVGFMEGDVIDYVKNRRKDVVFVRNPDYRNTTNSYSLHLGSRGIKDGFLSFDGDLLVNPTSFTSFINRCSNGRSVIGITPSKTEEAVFVRLDADKGLLTGFDVVNKSDFEWSGLAYFSGITIEKNSGFVFHEIEKHLPLDYAVIDCFEIDTPADLGVAKMGVMRWLE
jgi:choline kinase